MAWSSRIKRVLAERDVAPRFLVDGFRLGTGPRPGRVRLSSHSEDGYIQAIRRGGLQGGARSLTVGSWSSSTGSWTVKLAGHLSRKRLRLQRGIGLRLRIGFAGWELADFETVEIGVLSDVQYDGEGITLQVRDLLYAMQSRPSRTGGELSLYYNSPVTTTLFGSYTVGDGQIDATGGSAFSKPTGESGFLSVVGDTSTFYIGWSSWASGTFTVAETDLLGTTRNNTASGNLITEVAGGLAHPVDQALRIITSTGGGTNGTHDILPAAWGLGLDASLVDAHDAARFKARSTPASGSATLPILQVAPQENPYSWLSGWLAQGGWFVTQRQAQLTVRCATNINSATPPTVWDITDDDIESIESYSAYSQSSPVEYRSHRVTTATGSTTYSGQVRTTPSVQRKTLDLSALVFDNEPAWRTEIGDRLKLWSTRIPEEVVLRLRGWRMRQAAVGDFALLTTRRVSGRLEKDVRGFSRRRGMITAISGSWLSPWTSVTVTIIPRREDK